MQLPDKIVGRDAREVRDMFKTFVDMEPQYNWVDGAPEITPCGMTLDFIRKSLGISDAEAKKVQRALIDEIWIDKNHLYPNNIGM